MFGGIIDLDGRPFSRASLQRLASGLNRPDAALPMFAGEGSVGVVYRKFATTPGEENSEYLIHEPGRAIAVFDGYACEFGRSGLRGAGILDACLRHPDSKFPGLDGDFALSVWDCRRNRLTLARDAFGVRGLFYTIQNRSFCWATSIQALLHLPAVPRTLDDDYAAQYLLDDPSADRSPFRSISAAPPGHVVVVEGGMVRLKRWWDPQLEYLDGIGDEECEDRTRSLLRNSVAARLETNSKVTALLSGGLDSSAIAGFSDQVAPLRKIDTISFLFDDPEGGEEEFLVEMERARSRQSFRLHASDSQAFAMLPDPDHVSFPAPIHCFGNRISKVVEILSQLGSRTILSGWGGDEVFLGASAWTDVLADRISDGNLRGIAAEAWTWARISGKPIPSMLWDAAAHAVFRRTNEKPAEEDADWIAPNLRHRLVSADVTSRMLVPGQRSRKKNHHAACIARTIRPVAAGYASLPTTLGSFDVRFPMLDRPLIEFVLSIPNSQFQRVTARRSLLRRAMAGIVPSRICARETKCGPSIALLRAMQSQPNRIRQLLLSGSRLVELGLADPHKLEISLERLLAGYLQVLPGLLRAISFEIWLKNLDSFRPSDSGDPDLPAEIAGATPHESNHFASAKSP